MVQANNLGGFLVIEEQKYPRARTQVILYLIRKSNIPCPKQSDRCDSSNDMVGIYEFEVWDLLLVYYNGLFFDKGDAFLGLARILKTTILLPEF